MDRKMAHIDTIYLDLKYKSEKFPISLTKEDSLLKFRIEIIINYLNKEMGGVIINNKIRF